MDCPLEFLQIAMIVLFRDGGRGVVEGPPSSLSIETFREDDRKHELFDGDATSTVKAN